MARLRLLLDEDVRPLLAETLRRRGWDAWHVLELDRTGRSDAEQLAFAVAERRALLTHNVRDFVLLHRQYQSRGKRHHGILLCDQLPFRALLQRAVRCLSRTTPAAARNRLVWLHDFT